jgi:hypothetical protein
LWQETQFKLARIGRAAGLSTPRHKDKGVTLRSR